MTVKKRFKNVSLPTPLYEKIDALSKKIFEIPLSVPKVIAWLLEKQERRYNGKRKKEIKEEN
tara:strand:- start:49 stop:234 length:186 start_codon:yes stop_codon:yes gene_type:complete